MLSPFTCKSPSCSLSLLLFPRKSPSNSLTLYSQKLLDLSVCNLLLQKPLALSHLLLAKTPHVLHLSSFACKSPLCSFYFSNPALLKAACTLSVNLGSQDPLCSLTLHLQKPLLSHPSLTKALQALSLSHPSLAKAPCALSLILHSQNPPLSLTLRLPKPLAHTLTFCSKSPSSSLSLFACKSPTLHSQKPFMLYLFLTLCSLKPIALSLTLHSQNPSCSFSHLSLAKAACMLSHPLFAKAPLFLSHVHIHFPKSLSFLSLSPLL